MNILGGQKLTKLITGSFIMRAEWTTSVHKAGVDVIHTRICHFYQNSSFIYA